MDSPNERVKSKIEKSVSEFIKTIAEDVKKEGYRVPEQTVLRDEDGVAKPKLVSAPRKLISLYSSRQDEFFRETAEWLISSENSFPSDDCANDDVPTVVLGDPENLPTKNESRIFTHVNSIFNFAGDVLNYVGKVEFDKEAFDEAYRQEFLKNYQTGLEQTEVVVPLQNFVGPNSREADEKSVLLEGFEFHDESGYHRVEQISLSKLTVSEAEALATFEYNYRQGNSTGLLQSGQWCVRAFVKSAESDVALYGPGVEIGERIVTALRLYGPTKGPVGFERAFELARGWREYRFGIPDVVNADEPHRQPEFSRDTYYLDETEIDEFAEFWEQLGTEIRLDPSFDLSTSLRRFNEMYIKPYPEDRLLDCMIACEGLLLKGPGSPGTKRSRMSLRTSFLLDEYHDFDREFVRRVIKQAYSRRNSVIHGDKYLANIINPESSIEDESFVHPNQFLTELREILGKIITSYLEARSEGTSVAQLNMAIDEAMENAEFSRPK